MGQIGAGRVWRESEEKEADDDGGDLLEALGWRRLLRS